MPRSRPAGEPARRQRRGHAARADRAIWRRHRSPKLEHSGLRARRSEPRSPVLAAEGSTRIQRGTAGCPRDYAGSGWPMCLGARHRVRRSELPTASISRRLGGERSNERGSVNASYRSEAGDRCGGCRSSGGLERGEPGRSAGRRGIRSGAAHCRGVSRRRHPTPRFWFWAGARVWPASRRWLGSAAAVGDAD